MNRLHIHFKQANLTRRIDFPTTQEAYEYANKKVSFSAIWRIELETEEGSFRALWDAEWTPLSQAKGLEMPKDWGLPNSDAPVEAPPEFNQLMDLEISVYAMVTLPNGDGGLASAQIPEPAPEYWDVHVKAYPEGTNNNSYVLLEVEDIPTTAKVEQVLDLLQLVFPDAEIEEI